MRAVVEFHGVDGDLPPIEIIIADGAKNEDVCIKISDQVNMKETNAFILLYHPKVCVNQGGGIIRSKTMKIYDYFYTTAPQQFENLTAPDFSVESPMSGLGKCIYYIALYAFCKYKGCGCVDDSYSIIRLRTPAKSNLC
jgi:hypothetical protein